MKEITKVQREFLRILENFMRGTTYTLSDNFLTGVQGALSENPNDDVSQLTELFQMSKRHQMAAAVFEQIRGNDIWKLPECRQLFQSWKRETQKDVMTQMQRTAGFLDIYDAFCRAGVTPLIIKGLICRNLYDKPDYRVSGDEDILVHREDFLVCDQILLEAGFKRKDLDIPAEENVLEGKIQEDLPYEIPYINPQSGVYIEMHFQLFPEEAEAYGHLNAEFGQAFEHAIELEVQGKRVYTLCPTEHLFYLICHSFKHFLHSGFGLRQVCDMVLMAEQYCNSADGGIDWQDIRERLERLRMRPYWEALMQIGTEWFGFDKESAGISETLWNNEVDSMPMLKDLLDSGIYGDSSAQRKHSSNMTLAAVSAGKANTANSLGNSLFPGKEYMQGRFPWLKKNGWLLPVAYGIRIFKYLSKKTDSGTQNVVRIGLDRVELLRQYGVID